MSTDIYYRDNLIEVIKASWFTVEVGTYMYTRVKKVIDPEKHLLVIHDRDEITVVTEEKNLAVLGEYESNKEKWKLVNIRCGKPFYCVGFIAYITDALATEGIDIVLTSSFSNDLVLVMESDLQKAIDILITKGFSCK
jgi:hypothetical protein